MNRNLENLLNNINEVVNAFDSNPDCSIEINNIADYIAINNCGDEYFFQEHERDILEKEYAESGVSEYIYLKDYLKYVSQNW